MSIPMMPSPTEAELEILQVLWQQGPSSVRSINEVLNRQREVGYTTTLKLLQIMFEKGLVQRNATERIHIYMAAVEEGATQQRLLQRVVDTLFRGSAGQLVMQALGSHEPSSEELSAIKALIEEMERNTKNT